ncbi:AfsA-related hotdog domain-containing protein [Agarilytica rhodophyticola]|uniref:AfsA-related hotdog domain-containing protein n=1 Tax=Agarilytica rhodophyticola TaxID=1737490 RepID=UPI000B342CF7|nr:AfsA-related hotdog domain-containing protein [Agarilytica rhodophyticola]
MNIEKLYIIGSKFRDFSNGKNVITYEDFLNFSSKNLNSHSTIIIGQGVSFEKVKNIKRCLSNLNPKHSFLILENSSLKVEKNRVHKKFDRNVFISNLIRVNKNSFTAHLAVDDGCDEMSDHQSGAHVQGMLLVEAARQMCMACTDFIVDKATERMGFVLKNQRVTFKNFVFPVDVSIFLEFNAIDITAKTGIASINFVQFDRVCCEVTWEWKGAKQDVLRTMEQYNVKKAISQLTKIN